MFRYIIIGLMIILIIPSKTKGQTPKKKTTRISVEYIKDYSKNENIVATIRVREERYVPLSGASIFFFNVNDSSRVLVQKMKSDENGQAILFLEESSNIHKDSSGLITFDVEYEGNTENKSSKKKILIKRADLSMSFIKIDTVKSIQAIANEIDDEGKTTPIKNIKISFFVKGTFSLYPFGDGKTDKNGIVKLDFPVSMPGDTAGVLSIVARIEDDDIYGIIESKSEINWGIPVPIPEVERRGLGDTDAPLWMVYTLIILLSAVWFHYLYVVFLIVKIKLSKKVTHGT